MVWTYCKNMPGLLFWLYLPQHVLMNIVAVFVLALRGQGRIALQAKYDTLKHMPSVWRDRREIQRTRQLRSFALWRLMSRGFIQLFRRR
jgi:hypothetical protein